MSNKTMITSLNYKDTKKYIRSSNGLSIEERRKWWPILHHINKERDKEILNSKGETLNQIKIDDGMNVFDEIIKEHKHFEIPISVAVKSLITIISTNITDKTVVYKIVDEELNDPVKYLGKSTNHLLGKIECFKEILSDYVPKTYNVLYDIDALNPIFLKHIFIYYFIKILPINVVNKIFDIYLLEGSKTLIRFGIALIAIHKAEIKSSNFSNGNEFWEYLKNIYINNVNIDEDQLFKQLHSIAFDLNRNIFEKFFRPLYVSNKHLKSLLQQYEGSHKFDDYEITWLESDKSLLNSNVPNHISLKSISDLLPDDYATYLENQMPDLSSINSYIKKFSTAKHGYSLESLYSSVNGSPCVLLLRPVNTNITIGFFTANEVKFIGQNRIVEDPEAFIFILDGENNHIYRWIGKSKDYTILSTTERQTAVFNNDFIRFGASHSKGTNAIYIDGDLKTCVCSYSDTYNNAPLYLNGSMFFIESVEVLCGVSIF